jgi:hypothetical protein
MADGPRFFQLQIGRSFIEGWIQKMSRIDFLNVGVCLLISWTQKNYLGTHVFVLNLFHYGIPYNSRPGRHLPFWL